MGLEVRSVQCGMRELAGALQSRASSRPFWVRRVQSSRRPDFNHWVWGPAAGLWDDGHYPEAVKAAASRLLDVEWPAKLSLDRGAWTVSEAFSDKAHRLAVLDFSFRELQRLPTTRRNAHD